MDSHVKTETGNVETVMYFNNTPAYLKETYGPEERRNFYMEISCKRYLVDIGRHFTRDSVQTVCSQICMPIDTGFRVKNRSNLNIDIGTRVQSWLLKKIENARSEKKRRLRVSLSCLSYLLAGWLGLAWLGLA